MKVALVQFYIFQANRSLKVIKAARCNFGNEYGYISVLMTMPGLRAINEPSGL